MAAAILHIITIYYILQYTVDMVPRRRGVGGGSMNRWRLDRRRASNTHRYIFIIYVLSNLHYTSLYYNRHLNRLNSLNHTYIGYVYAFKRDQFNF